VKGAVEALSQRFKHCAGQFCECLQYVMSNIYPLW